MALTKRLLELLIMERKNDASTNGTVLVVDDDSSVLVLMQTLLSAAGYRVVVASTAGDAIRLATQRHLHLDLAVVDVRLPDMQGPQLADQLLGLRTNLRVLFMSGFVDEEIVRIKLLDHRGFLAKPFGNDGLLRAVADAMKAPACVAVFTEPPARASAAH